MLPTAVEINRLNSGQACLGGCLVLCNMLYTTDFDIVDVLMQTRPLYVHIRVALQTHASLLQRVSYAAEVAEEHALRLQQQVRRKTLTPFRCLGHQRGKTSKRNDNNYSIGHTHSSPGCSGGPTLRTRFGDFGAHFPWDLA